MKKNKVIILTSIIIGVLVLVLGVTYAVMTFDQTGGNTQLVLGDIYMHYKETSGLSISDMVPGAPYSNYFEFQVSGKNTYTKKDIYYDFLVTRGDLPEGKTEENRIPDEYLKFKLVSVVGDVETILLEDETYKDLTNQRIYVETIAKNTTNEVNRTYRLYVTVDYSLVIGNTENAVFTMDEWEDAFASIKVNVTGDFLEKKVVSYNDCFKTKTLSDGTLEITDYYKYNPSSTNELYQNPLCTTDVIIPSSIDGVDITSIGSNAFYSNDITSVVIPNSVTSIGTSAFSFNNLTSVEIPNSVTSIASSAFESNELTSVGIPNSVNTIGSSAFEYNYLTSLEIPDSVTTIGDLAFHYNRLTSIVIPNSVTHIGGGAFNANRIYGDEGIIYARTDVNRDGIAEIDTTKIVSFNYGGGGEGEEIIIIPNTVTTIGAKAFMSNSLMANVKIPNSVTTIEEYAFSENALTNVVIPSSVTTIGYEAFNLNEIQSLTFEENSSLTTIGNSAFSDNELTSVVIPDSVIEIGASAFANNYLEMATIGSGIQYIDVAAFAEQELESITFTSHTCDEIKNIRNNIRYTPEYYFPWLAYESPYYLDDYKASIFGTDGECSY